MGRCRGLCRPRACFENRQQRRATLDDVRTRSGCGQSSLAPGPLLHERCQQRELVREIGQYSFEIPLHGPRGPPPRALRGLAGVAPQLKLTRDRLLDRLSIREVRRAARSGADEVGLVQREALGKRRHLDQAGHALGRGGGEGEPVPPTPDDLAEGAHGHAAPFLGQRLPGAQEIAGASRLAFASDADRERRDLGRADALVFEGGPIQDESDAPRIVRAQDLGQRGIEERFETPPQHALNESGIEKRREGVRRRKSHRGTLPRHETQWRYPAPGCPVPRGQPP